MTGVASLYEQFAAGHPDWSDERVVREICERLLEEAEATPPVDAELVASLCGIASVEYRVVGPAGMLVCRDGTWVASIRADDGFERQRFTLLHEGGHTLLPDFKRGGLYHRCQGPRTRQEQLCDIAAAELLLPRRFFVGDVAQAGYGIEAVESLATKYRASMQATARRVVDISPRPLCLMVFHMAHKPADRGREDTRAPKLRLEYAYSDEFPFPLRHKSADNGSVFASAWEGEDAKSLIDLGGYFAEPVGDCAVSARRYGDKVLALAHSASLS
jgi:hypothetical protein